VGSSQWFGPSAALSDAEFVLFCLPYSGAGASIFRSWQAAFPSTVEVAAVHLPGREDRIAEPHSLSPRAIARAIAARTDRPYAIYGHSLGARLGFEVIHAMRQLGAPLPTRFYAAASRPPDIADPLAPSVERPDEEFLGTLINRISAPAELRDEPELRELLLPVLRGDFGWIHSRAYHPGSALDVPVVALAGADDPVSGPLHMLGWSRHTSASFRLHTLPGDHFFVRTAADDISRLIVGDLTASDKAAPGRTRGRPEPGEVHIWLANLDQLPGLCAARSELSPHQGRRLARLRDDESRHRYIGRCAATRRVLRAYGIDATAAALPGGADAPPGGCWPAGLHIDLSQSGGLLLIGVTAEDGIGVGLKQLGDSSPAAARAESAERAMRKAADLDHSAFGAWRPDPAALHVTHLPLDGAIAAVALTAERFLLRFETVTEVAP
jgi:surfactin synthase thioesterase subunit